MNNKDIFITEIEDKVSANLYKIFDNKIAEKIVVAVSGGADSLALVFILKNILNNTKNSIIALTVDHSIRPEAAKEASYVNEILTEHNIEHHILKWDGKIPKSNKQESARDIRYSLISNWCIDNNIIDVITAHNYDDQAETFLLRLLRGSGSYGLSAMDEISHRDDIRIIRPSLNIKKEELLEYIRYKNIKWIEDPSNVNPNYDRTLVRKFLNNNSNNLPIESDLLKKRLYDTASHMRRIRNMTDFYVKKFINDNININKIGYCSFDEGVFDNIPEEIALRGLSDILYMIGNSDKPPRFSKILELYHKLKSKAKNDITLNNCRIYHSKRDSKKKIIYISYEMKNNFIESQNIESNHYIFDNRFNINIKNYNIKKKYKVSYVDKNMVDENKSIIRLLDIPRHILYSLPAVTIDNKLVMVGGLLLDNDKEVVDIDINIRKYSKN